MEQSKHGGQRKDAGRITTNLRGLDISDMGAELSEPPNWYVADISVYKCGLCGAVWWSGYTADAYDDETNEIASTHVEGKQEKHLKSCPNYGNEINA